MAIAYVARYATSRAKLRAYLGRKVRERGWEEEGGEAPIEAVVTRCADMGYVDDAAFAASREAALLRRGFGERRIAQALHAAGVSGQPRTAPSEDDQMAAALQLARRKRIGPFASGDPDQAQRQKHLAVLLRAGHPMPIARRVVNASPGDDLLEA